MITAMILLSPGAYAESLQDQINTLNQQASDQQNQANALHAQADTLANKLAGINQQVKEIRTQLALSRAKSEKLAADIEENKKLLDAKRTTLGENIRAIYQQSQVTPIEMLASSKNFSDFVDKQQYLDTIKAHIEESLQQIKKLKADLDKQQEDVQALIIQQKSLAEGLQIQQNEAANLLATTQGDEARYAQQAQASNSEKTKLQAQQAALLARTFGGSVSGGVPCGGGYPGRWCNAEQDSLVDNWGMYNRECVSYTAFKVAASGRVMPYWGGRGNAKEWPGNAQGAGIPVDGNPKAGDVAISTAGPFGHAMYVERVNGNGTIFVSQYNFGNNGEYSTNTISPSGLYFLHF